MIFFNNKKKDSVISAIDICIGKLVTGETFDELKKFGTVGDLIQYAIIQTYKRLTIEKEPTTRVLSQNFSINTTPEVLQTSFDYILEVPGETVLVDVR